MTTKGPAAVATLNPFQQVEAETIAFSSGLKTEVSSDTGAGMNVASISNGDYIKVKEVDFADGVTSFEARVSSAVSNAKIELHLDSESGSLLGTCDVSGASSWTTKSCAVSGGSGKHDLFLKFVGGSGDLFKFNWWRFSGPTMPGTGGTGGTGGGGTTGPGAGGLDGSSGNGTTSQAGATSTAAGTAGVAAGGFGGTIASAGSSVGGSAVSLAGANSAGSANAAGRAGNTQTAAGAGGNGAVGTDPGSCACRAGANAENSGLAAAVWMVLSTLLLRRRRD